jgi:hypothetical protein
MTTQNVKEELNKDKGNLREKNQREILKIKSPFSQTKNHSDRPLSRLEEWKTKSQSPKIKWKLKKKQKKS